MSGEPLKALALATLSDMYKLTKGKIPIIGVGGIANGKDAYERILAGASLVQMYSMLVHDGPGCVIRAKHELAACLAADGYNNVQEAVGAAHK